MLGNDVDVGEQFHHQAVTENQRAGGCARQSDGAEKMHWPGEIFQEKTNRQDVEQHAEGPAQAIVGGSHGALRVLDGHFGHARAVETRQRGNETVQFAVEVDVVEHLGAVGLEGRSEIAKIDARGFRHHPVGDARGNPASDGVVDAVFSPAARDIEALVDFAQQGGNVFGRVLQVSVHGDDDVALRFVKACRERRGLAEIAPQANHFQARIGLYEIGQQLVTAVSRGIVDKENFVRPRQSEQHGRQPVVQRQNRAFFVMDGNNDREHGSVHYTGRAGWDLPHIGAAC